MFLWETVQAFLKTSISSGTKITYIKKIKTDKKILGEKWTFESDNKKSKTSVREVLHATSSANINIFLTKLIQQFCKVKYTILSILSIFIIERDILEVSAPRLFACV